MQIRISFVSNSSSSSFVITSVQGGHPYDKKICVSDPLIIPMFGTSFDFSHFDFVPYKDIFSKINYVILLAVRLEIDKNQFDQILEVIKDYFGVKKIINRLTLDASATVYNSYDYIGDISKEEFNKNYSFIEGILPESPHGEPHKKEDLYFILNKKKVSEFLFNKDSVLICGGDSDDKFSLIEAAINSNQTALLKAYLEKFLNKNNQSLKM